MWIILCVSCNRHRAALPTGSDEIEDYPAAVVEKR